MVTLFCAIIGMKGSVIPVDIDASQLVGELKDANKVKKPRMLSCDANDLHLSPA